MEAGKHLRRAVPGSVPAVFCLTDRGYQKKKEVTDIDVTGRDVYKRQPPPLISEYIFDPYLCPVGFGPYTNQKFPPTNPNLLPDV